MSVDYTHKRAVFSPTIYPTNERPDIVLWSESSRRVLLLELTCPAEEGIEAAETRKQQRYQSLLSGINSSKCWLADLYTLEIGARGLVGCRTFKVFRLLGLGVLKQIHCAGLCLLFLLVARLRSIVHIRLTVGSLKDLSMPLPRSPLPFNPLGVSVLRVLLRRK